MSHSSVRFLVVYSAVVTLVFAVTIFTGFAVGKKSTSIDVLDVHRINVREPDGTIRMVISDKSEWPGSYVRGKEMARPSRRSTGILFIDDDGTEIGGLIFGGHKDKDGSISSNGHLSFDRYDQDQIFSIDAGEDKGKHYSKMVFSDRGDHPIEEEIDEGERIKALPEDQRAAAWEEFEKKFPGDYPRIVLARATDNSAVLRMKDSRGRDRIVLAVGADGAPRIQLLDENGSTVSQLPAK